MKPHQIVAAIMGGDWRYLDELKVRLAQLSDLLGEVPGFAEMNPEQKAETVHQLAAHFFKKP